MGPYLSPTNSNSALPVAMWLVSCALSVCLTQTPVFLRLHPLRHPMPPPARPHQRCSKRTHCARPNHAKGSLPVSDSTAAAAELPSASARRPLCEPARQAPQSALQPAAVSPPQPARTRSAHALAGLSLQPARADRGAVSAPSASAAAGAIPPWSPTPWFRRQSVPTPWFRRHSAAGQPHQTTSPRGIGRLRWERRGKGQRRLRTASGGARLAASASQSRCTAALKAQIGEGNVGFARCESGG